MSKKRRSDKTKLSILKEASNESSSSNSQQSQIHPQQNQDNISSSMPSLKLASMAQSMMVDAVNNAQENPSKTAKKNSIKMKNNHQMKFTSNSMNTRKSAQAEEDTLEIQYDSNGSEVRASHPGHHRTDTLQTPMPQNISSVNITDDESESMDLSANDDRNSMIDRNQSQSIAIRPNTKTIPIYASNNSRNHPNHHRSTIRRSSPRQHQRYQTLSPMNYVWKNI